MSLREDLNLLAPRLRRFARALLRGHPAPSEAADGLVGLALRRAYEVGVSQHAPDPHIEAYACLIEANREQLRAALGSAGLGAPGLGTPGLGAPGFGALGFGAPGSGAQSLGVQMRAGGAYATEPHKPEKPSFENGPNACEPSDALSSALCALKLEEREALLLVSLEGLSHAQASRALKISRPILIARLSRAREKLPVNLQARSAARRAHPRPSHLRVVK